jgi:hypothetical protein
VGCPQAGYLFWQKPGFFQHCIGIEIQQRRSAPRAYRRRIHPERRVERLVWTEERVVEFDDVSVFDELRFAEYLGREVKWSAGDARVTEERDPARCGTGSKERLGLGNKLRQAAEGFRRANLEVLVLTRIVEPGYRDDSPVEFWAERAD